jgi:hypothetical protein
MTFEQTRLLATIGGMVLVLFLAGLISYLNDGRIVIENQHILITLLVGLCAFLGWPRPKTDQSGDHNPPDRDAV